MNRGLAGLGLKKFETAWDDYEDRYHEDNFINERFKTLQRWPGPGREVLPVLVWAEQGLGDEIMFASMYDELKHLKEKFAIECNPRLLDIFKESFPHIFFFPTLSLKDTSAFKYQISIASLGRVLRRSESSFEVAQRDDGYLKQSKKSLSKAAATALERLPRPWVGVSWQSFALTKNFRSRKSIPSKEFEEVTKNFHGSFINLQFSNPHRHENHGEETLPENVHSLPGIDLKEDINGLSNLIKKMDHVITIGNTVAHICGAFGIKTSVLLPSVADWRWGFAGQRSLWYPTLDLYRNQGPDSWNALLEKIRLEVLPKVAP